MILPAEWHPTVPVAPQWHPTVPSVLKDPSMYVPVPAVTPVGKSLIYRIREIISTDWLKDLDNRSILGKMAAVHTWAPG